MEDLKNSILKNLYGHYYESAPGLRNQSVEGVFPNASPNDVHANFNELAQESLIKLSPSGYYRITELGIEYLEDGGLVDDSKLCQRSDIVKTLMEYYERDVNEYVTRDILVGKLGIPESDKIQPQLQVLEDRGYVDYNPSMGDNFDVRLTSAGYKLAKNLS